MPRTPPTTGTTLPAGPTPSRSRCCAASSGFTGVTITDSLDGTAYARGRPGSDSLSAQRAAGTDMILLTGSEASTRSVFDPLSTGSANGIDVERRPCGPPYARIVALKTGEPRTEHLFVSCADW